MRQNPKPRAIDSKSEAPIASVRFQPTGKLYDFDARNCREVVPGDFVLVETVGVGQCELDIMGNVDTVVVVLVPGSGDSIQAMKAGLLEAADILVVNKGDFPGAQNLVMDIQSILG